MIRKILLGGIMLVCVGILIFALQKQRARERAEESAAADNETVTPARPPRGFELIKFNKDTNEVEAIITGTRFEEKAEKGPIEITRPKITLLKDENSRTVITADAGRIEGREEDKMQEGWLKGNVVLTVTDLETGDNTVLTCEEMQYQGSREQIFIPGAMKITSRTMEVTGSRLTADANVGKATLEKDVRLVMKETSGGALESLSAGPVDTSEAVEPAPAKPLVITCDGTLVFHKDLNRATFEKNVLAVQGDDGVRGDSMIVEFERKPRPVGEDGKARGDVLSMRRVVIRSERKEGVIVEGPSRQAWGERLEYDGTAELLVFTGSPCRSVQKSGKETYRIEGNEVRFGRKGLLAEGEKLPAGMSAETQKVHIRGTPARAVSVTAEGEPSSKLTGTRIIFDQDTGIVWVAGDDRFPASAEQEGNRVTGVEIAFFQKTETHGEKVLGRGPGRLRIERRARGDAQRGAGPTIVDFGDTMSYLPDEQRAEFTGGVKLVDADTTSNSRTLAIEMAEGKEPGSREIRKVTATGSVVVTGEGRTAVGETLVYNYPAGGQGPFTVQLTAASGESCEIRSDEFVWRSGRIDLTETPTESGRKAVHATGLGKGYFLYKGAAGKPGADRPAEPFEVSYEKSGSFDDAALQAVFEGNVHLKRAELTLDARHVVMDFVREATKAEDGTETEKLDLKALTATDDVTVRTGAAEELTTAVGRKLIWRRSEGTARLLGQPGEDGMARVRREGSTLAAPVMIAFLKDDELDKVVTTGGGHLTGYTRPRKQTADAKPQRMDVTWIGDGLYQTLQVNEPDVEPTSMARVQGRARGFGPDGDVTADVLTVFLGPGPKQESDKKLNVEVRRALAVGNARAKMFMPEGNYYRYAKGDSLDWDRLRGNMVIMSEAGDAVVWDNSNEWIGKKLVVNRTPEGKVEAELTSSRRIIFYEEGTPYVPSPDARGWKPIY